MSQEETTAVQQENAAFRKRIQELQSGSVLVPGLTSPPVSASLIQSSLVSVDYPVSLLTVQADHLPHLGDFSADETHFALPQSKIDQPTQLGFTTEDARWVLVKSNDNVLVVADILFSYPPVPSVRFRFESSHPDNPQYRLVRG